MKMYRKRIDPLVVLQALKMLRTPDLKPFIVYVKAPSFDRLRDTRTTAYARSTFVENGNRAFTVSGGLVTGGILWSQAAPDGHRWKLLVTGCNCWSHVVPAGCSWQLMVTAGN